MAVAPHVTTTEDLRRVQDATRWRLVILHPRPIARVEGSHAYLDGKSRGDNPYTLSTPEWAGWEQGWLNELAENS